ncbi:hypothetical protein Pla163_21800 [Planctomycetes bacterium Pla163]|uniref:Oxygen tolerance n=2 Tax=Rohdeia mirabilis TaxID=2528008 RepID=A0A518D0V3_9BACT|nr:hypothetical protein Pla163_21800 [Planctomycetes bacterium Pla163]
MLCALWLWTGVATQDPGPGGASAENEHVRLLASLDPAEPFVFEPFTLRLELLVERSFLDERVIAPSLRVLDVPALVWTGVGDAVGLDGRADGGELVRLPSESDEARLSIALDGVTASARRDADRELDGATWAVFAVELELRADGPAALADLAPRAELAVADHFRTDLFGERVPLDRRAVLVRADAAWRPLLRPLPTDGAPLGFEGVVGAFELEGGDVRPGEVEVDAKFEVGLRVVGERNLDLVRRAPPRPVDDTDVHFLGVRARTESDALELTYEFVAVAAGPRRPLEFELDLFEPGAGYRTLAASVQMPVVLPGPNGAGGADVPGARDAEVPAEHHGSEPAGDDDGPFALLAVAAFGLLVVAGVLVARARSRRTPVDPRVLAADEAARAANGAWPALGAYVRTRLDLPAAAEQGHGVALALVGAGVEVELAQRVEDGLGAATAARFSGARVPDGGEALLDAVRRALAGADAGTR